MTSEETEQEHFEAVIIGAGMAGLAAGIRLAIAGKKVIILERHNASGGLNSFYSIEGRKYDVGLHAMTNFVPKGTRGTPLAKLLRQLRIPYDSLDLCPQFGSRISFPEHDLKFSNDFGLLETEVARSFPRQIDGFQSLVKDIRHLDAFNLRAPRVSARLAVRRYISDSTLEDMLFCPVMYYGSAQEHDMDFNQFAIMFRSLFFEGFARPFEGVRVIVRLLQNKYRELGGVRRMKCGIQKIQCDGTHATALTLDSGKIIHADKIISTAGIVETLRLCTDKQEDCAGENIGRLSFAETITVLDKQPVNLGWEDTIIFFNTRNRFRYAEVKDGLVDPTSGVICLPNNYDYGKRKLSEGILRITAMANHNRWCALNESDYQAEKANWYEQLQKVALKILPDLPNDIANTQLNAHRITKDMFTPRTVRKYTGHLNGAIYGATNKSKQGTTHLENLFIAGTDQGFLGIVGAMLSGISMANLHILKDR